MSNLNLRNLTNNFQDVRLVSLASWRQAAEISPRDRGGPYVVMQEGYDPEDTRMIAEEFVLGRSGKWLSLGLFYRMPVPDRRTEFVFGTVGEVMQMMGNLPPKPVVMRRGDAKEEAGAPEADEMAAALQAGKQQPPGGATPAA
jgi:hypothetical protein